MFIYDFTKNLRMFKLKANFKNLGGGDCTFFFLMGKYSFHWSKIGLQQDKRKNYSKSSIKICWMKGGETPFHVWDWPVSSASLANSWVALLSSLFRCWKVLQLKTRAEDLISYIIWPRTPLFSLELTTRIRAKTSDSKIALEEPISTTKRTPWCKAKASVTEAGKANGSSLLRAPIVAPVWSQIIILILECSPSFVVAPSSLILWKPEEGGD